MNGKSDFNWPTRVYWEDTDAGGVVYHSRYLAFLERARTEWMRTIGYGQMELSTTYHTVFAVSSMEIRYLLPARLDDLLHVHVTVKECKRASIILLQKIVRQTQTLLNAQVRLAALSTQGFRPCGIPMTVYADIQKHSQIDPSTV